MVNILAFKVHDMFTDSASKHSIQGGYFMSLISFIGIGIAVIVISMIFLILKANKGNGNNKPNLFSLVALSLIILNWVIYLAVLYLTDSYIIIAGKIGDFIFTPVWFIVSIIALLAAYKEFRNNRIFAVVVSGLAIINAIVGMLLWGIGNM